MSLYLSKLESKLDKALSKETRESLTEWIGFKRNKPQTTRTMRQRRSRMVSRNGCTTTKPCNKNNERV